MCLQMRLLNRKSGSLQVSATQPGDSMIENGQRMPVPESEEQRTEQINLRLTRSEKYRLEDSARRGGFRGVSDYVRSAALGK